MQEQNSTKCSIPMCDRDARKSGLCGAHYMRKRRGMPPWPIANDPPSKKAAHLIDKHSSPAGCWEWLGSKDGKGYGQMQNNGRTYLAHRVVYEIECGPIQDEMELDHLCRNPGCVNPAHLEPTTHAENVRRGVSPPAINARKTYCKRGHPFDDENTFIAKSGKRRCRACDRERERQRPKRSRRKA
jgi:hypothetical protein